MSRTCRKISGTIEQPSLHEPARLGTTEDARTRRGSSSWHRPTRMEARGLTREMLKEGATVTAEGYQHRTDTAEMRAERITIDGKTIELR